MAKMPTDPLRPLLGQTALVTGASRGIGRAVALELGRAGANVVVNFNSSPAEADSLVREIIDVGSSALAHRANVSEEGQVRAIFERACSEFGTIDILVA